MQTCCVWANFLEYSVQFLLASSTVSNEVFPQYFPVCFTAAKWAKSLKIISSV